MADVRLYERKTGKQVPQNGVIVILFPTAVTSAGASLEPTSQKMHRSVTNQADSIAATSFIQNSPVLRSKDVISRDVAKYFAFDRKISILATNAHYLDHLSKHSNTLERLLIRNNVILMRNVATPGTSATRWLVENNQSDDLNAFGFILEPISTTPSMKSTQQKSMSDSSIPRMVPHGGRLALAGLLLSSPRKELHCLSLTNLNRRMLDAKTYRPIQTGFATELEVSLKLRAPGYTYLSTPSSHQFLTASIPDQLKFGSCAKMPILVTRGVSSVVSISNVVAWENERKKNTQNQDTAWLIDDQAILFQVISVGEEPPIDGPPTRLFIEPDVLVWLRQSRNVRIFGFDHQLESLLGNRHEIEMTLGQLDDTIAIYNVMNLASIRSQKTANEPTAFQYGNDTNPVTGCSRFQCAFVSLRLWPASLAPVQLFAVSTTPSSTGTNSADRPDNDSAMYDDEDYDGSPKDGSQAAATSAGQQLIILHNYKLLYIFLISLCVYFTE